MSEFDIPKYLESVELPENPGIEFGINETMDAVDFAISLVNAIVLAYEDGNLNLADFGYAITPFMKIPAVLSGMEAIPYELADLDESELNEIVNKVKSELNIEDEKAKEVVLKAIRLAYSVYDIIKSIKG